MSHIKFREPKKVAVNYLLDFAFWLDSQEGAIKDMTEKASQEGWTFYPTEQNRGWCKYSAKQLTIPMWAIRKDKEGTEYEGYSIYYLAHELAHIKAGQHAHHGVDFAKAFISICPAHLLHWEVDYKSRHYA